MPTKNIILICIIFLLFLAGLVRFYKLSSYPVQLNHDEVSQLYDLKSIIETKKDIYGNFLPLAFPSTGEYKVGHYIYISLVPYLILGDKEVTIRVAAAFFSTLTVMAVFLLVLNLTNKWKLGLLGAILIAVSPSEVFYGRKSFENVIGEFCIFAGLYCLTNYCNKGKKFGWLILALLLLLSSLYTYTSYIIVVPLLICVIFWSFRALLQRSWKILLLMGVLSTTPFFVIAQNKDVSYRASTVFFTQDPKLGREIDLIDKSNRFRDLLALKTYLEYMYTKYLNQLSLDYLFLNGLNLTNQAPLGVGPLYIFELPFVLIGLVYLLKKGENLNFRRVLVALPFISLLPSALTFEAHSPHRSMLAFSAFTLIGAFGIYFISRIIRNHQLWLAYWLILSLLLVLSFAEFVHVYLINYPYEKSQHLHYPYKEVALFVWSKYNDFNEIVVDPVYGQSAPTFAVAVHYYLAYYGNYSPARFQKDLSLTDKGIMFDKFSIRKIDWRVDRQLKNTLVIASPWSVPSSSISSEQILKSFYFYDGQLAFNAIQLRD